MNHPPSILIQILFYWDQVIFSYHRAARYWKATIQGYGIFFRIFFKKRNKSGLGLM